MDLEDPRIVAEALLRSRQGLRCLFITSKWYAPSPIFFSKTSIFSLFCCIFPPGFAETEGDETQERLDRISRMTEIEDLRASQDHPFAPLCIKVGIIIVCIYIFIICSRFSCQFFWNQDPRDYFDAQQANALKTLDDIRNKTEQTKSSLSISEAYGNLRDSISKIKTMGLSDPIVKPEVALMVTKSLLLIIQAMICDET